MEKRLFLNITDLVKINTWFKINGKTVLKILNWFKNKCNLNGVFDKFAYKS